MHLNSLVRSGLKVHRCTGSAGQNSRKEVMFAHRCRAHSKCDWWGDTQKAPESYCYRLRFYPGKIVSSFIRLDEHRDGLRIWLIWRKKHTKTLREFVDITELNTYKRNSDLRRKRGWVSTFVDITSGRRARKLIVDAANGRANCDTPVPCNTSNCGSAPRYTIWALSRAQPPCSPPSTARRSTRG